VLDNSVVMRWCFAENPNEYADGVLQLMSNNSQAIVPVLWRYEVILLTNYPLRSIFEKTT